MPKVKLAYAIVGVLVGASVFMSGCQHGSAPPRELTGKPDLKLEAGRKPFTTYYAIMVEGRKVGYGMATFRTEDDKAITELAGNLLWQEDGPSGAQGPSRAFTRHVETLGGRPIGLHQELRGRGKLTCTVVADGQIRVAEDGKSSAKTKTVTWPEGVLLWHGQYLLARRHGLAEGTTYTFKQIWLAPAEAHQVRARVGPRVEVDLLGRKRELTEVTYVCKPLSDRGPSSTIVTIVSHVDSDWTSHKILIRTEPGGSDITWIACPEAEAMRPPARK